MLYTVDIRDDYTAPEGPMDAAQYIDFVVNRAAQSYQRQYGTENVNAGVRAACDAFNGQSPVNAA